MPKDKASGKDKMEAIAGAHEHFIQSAIKRPGQLHRDLGVPEGEDIPHDKLEKAAKRSDKIGARARLAITLKKMHG